MTRPRRFPPPIAGGAQKTGWEALEKWVGGSGSSSGGGSESGGEAPEGAKKTGWEALDKWVGGPGGGKAAAPPPPPPSPGGPSGKTGWEALDKWVGDGGGGATPSSEASETNGAAADQAVAASAPSAETEGGGGFMGFLKRLFGGK